MKILVELEQTRALMIQSGMEYGFRHVKTIRLSKKLDKLMNEFDTLHHRDNLFDFHQQKN